MGGGGETGVYTIQTEVGYKNARAHGVVRGFAGVLYVKYATMAIFLIFLGVNMAVYVTLNGVQGLIVG